MREGIFRVLEGRLDPNLLREAGIDHGNASSDDEN